MKGSIKMPYYHCLKNCHKQIYDLLWIDQGMRKRLYSIISYIARTPIATVPLAIGSIIVLYNVLSLRITPASTSSATSTFIISKKDYTRTKRIISDSTSFISTKTYIFLVVDYSNLSKQEQLLMEKPLLPRNLTSQQINHFLTHILLWQYMQQNTIPISIIVREELQ